MKYIFYTLFVFLVLSSCQLREEVTLNKDGSGEYRLGIDMSAMLNTAQNIGKNKDTAVNKKISGMLPKKKVDSIIRLDKFIKKVKDSIELTPIEEKAIKEMKDMVMHIQIDEEAGKMKMEYIYPYKRLSDLNNFFQNLEVINTIENRYKGKEKVRITDGNVLKELAKYKVIYSYKNKVFTRKTEGSIAKKKKEGQKKDIEDFSKMFQYQIVYHFPSPIKSVNYKGEAKMSIDRKTLFIDVPLNSLEENSHLLDFEIILE